jgi:ankyrin repeat protein
VLHYAANDGDLQQVQRLLATEDVNARDNEGWTPLHFAAQSGEPEVVALLLDAGAQVDALNDKGMPPIYWAIMTPRGDQPATIRLLRERGADPTRETIKGYFGLSSPLDVVRDIGNKPDIVAEFADLL